MTDLKTINGKEYTFVGYTKDEVGFPILKADGLYQLFIGGAYGISDPCEFDSDERAIDEYTTAVIEEGI